MIKIINMESLIWVYVVVGVWSWLITIIGVVLSSWVVGVASHIRLGIGRRRLKSCGLCSCSSSAPTSINAVYSHTYEGGKDETDETKSSPAILIGIVFICKMCWTNHSLVTEKMSGLKLSCRDKEERGNKKHCFCMYHWVYYLKKI